MSRVCPGPGDAGYAVRRVVRVVLFGDESITPEPKPSASRLVLHFARNAKLQRAPELTLSVHGASRDDGQRLRPSICVIASFASSTPSMQLTLSATTSVPSGFLPRANTSTPQSMQS